MADGRFSGKIVTVTGGASGIGLATVQGFCAQGAHVAFCDIDEERGHDVARTLSDEGRSAEFYRCDVTQEAEVAAMMEAIVTRHGRIDAAVNNVAGSSGEQIGMDLHETPVDGFVDTFQRSLLSTFVCMKHEIAHMLRTGGGVIANTASVAGLRVTGSGTNGYCAAKAGAIHLSRVAAVRYATRNIRVNVVAPGYTSTPGVERALVSRDGAEALMADVRHFQPMERIMTPQEVASAFLYLCSDDASGVTGVTVSVDGGWNAR